MYFPCTLLRTHTRQLPLHLAYKVNKSKRNKFSILCTLCIWYQQAKLCSFFCYKDPKQYFVSYFRRYRGPYASPPLFPHLSFIICTTICFRININPLWNKIFTKILIKKCHCLPQTRYGTSTFILIHEYSQKSVFKPVHKC